MRPRIKPRDGARLQVVRVLMGFKKNPHGPGRVGTNFIISKLIRLEIQAIEAITMNASKTMSKLTQLGIQQTGAIFGFLVAWASSAAYAVNDLPGGPVVRQLNLHPAVSKIADDQYWLHWYLMIVCIAIFVAVFGVMFYSTWKHRKSVGHKVANFHESTAVEIAWTIVPFVIVIAMVLPATQLLLAQKDTTSADLTIKATGYQWKWGYDYLTGDGEGISFFSNLYSPPSRAVDSITLKSDSYALEVDNPVVVPVNKKIRMIFAANDAIHSWHIPGLGVKQDAIPGFVRDTWFNAQKIGTYRGLCSIEACGAGRACVLIVVNVVSDGDYRIWVEGKKKDMAANADDPDEIRTVGALTQRGEKAYAAN